MLQTPLLCYVGTNGEETAAAEADVGTQYIENTFFYKIPRLIALL